MKINVIESLEEAPTGRTLILTDPPNLREAQCCWTCKHMEGFSEHFPNGFDRFDRWCAKYSFVSHKIEVSQFQVCDAWERWGKE